jgi:hypothetical protein
MSFVNPPKKKQKSIEYYLILMSFVNLLFLLSEIKV